MGQLLVEICSHPTQLWGINFTKKSRKHVDVEQKMALEGQANIRCVMAVDYRQSSGRSKARAPHLSSSDNIGKVKRLCEEGRLKEALSILKLSFFVQQKSGIKAPLGEYVCVLKECGRRKALAEGKQVHELLVRRNLHSNIFIANNLIHMYSKCGSVLDAYKVFSTMPRRNVFSWTAIISTYADNGRCEQAILLYHQMKENGIAPDKVAFIVTLKACVRVSALEDGKRLHSDIINGDLESDVIMQSILVDMYAKCGCLEDSRKLFDKMHVRDVVSWNVMIAGYVKKGFAKEALNLYRQMKQEGVKPDRVTFVILLNACSRNAALEEGKELHSLILKGGFQADVFLQSSLVDMYAKCGCLEDARKLFDNMHERDVVSWNSMITGYAQSGLGKKALDLYEQMKQEGVEPDEITFVLLLKACASIGSLEQGKQLHFLIVQAGYESNVFIKSGLVDMYAKCGCLEGARELFNHMSEKNLSLWNAMITGYGQNGLEKEAFTLFEQMKQEGVQPNNITYVVLLNACSNIGALEEGKKLHSLILRTGLQIDLLIQSTLVNMYAKCGHLEYARELFDEMSDRDLVSWTAMIGAYARNGLGKEALALYEQMKQEGVYLDEVAYLCVLTACSRAGFVDEGRRIYGRMCQNKDITPTLEHYACMVDLLGRAGLLAEAEEFIMKMPVQPNSGIWLALLGAAKNHGHVEIGRRAFDCIMKLEPGNASPYVTLSNIYAGARRMDEVARLRKEMNDKNVKEVAACSWIEVDHQMHAFVEGDALISHPQSKKISMELEKLGSLMKSAGYKPDLSCVLDDLEDEEKEIALWKHSERLALAFGLISLSPGTPICIKKNVPVCVNCHNVTKFISKMVGRQITVRDSNEFHSFQNGFCSCGDYW